MSNPIGMNLLKCTDWKVFFFSQAPERGMGWGEGGVKVEGLQPRSSGKVEEEKEGKVTSKKEVLSFSSVLECPSRCSGSALVSKSV